MRQTNMQGKPLIMSPASLDRSALLSDMEARKAQTAIRDHQDKIARVAKTLEEAFIAEDLTFAAFQEVTDQFKNRAAMVLSKLTFKEIKERFYVATTPIGTGQKADGLREGGVTSGQRKDDKVGTPDGGPTTGGGSPDGKKTGNG